MYHKYTRLIALLVFLLALSGGCMRDNRDDCPAGENLVLRFTYTDKYDRDLFADNINSVAVFIFDNNQNYLQDFHLGKTQLDNFRGLRTNLNPGDYHIVCWGNITDKLTYVTMPEMNISGSYLTYSNAGESSPPVFYGPEHEIFSAAKNMDIYKLHIPGQSSVEKEICFMDASRRVKITVKGFSDNVNGVNQPPLATMTGIPDGYDFYLDLSPGQISYTYQTQMETGTYNTASTEFYTPCFEIDDSTQIILNSKSNNEELYSFFLQEYLDDNNINVALSDPIDIVIEFVSGGVSITMPGWGSGGIIYPINP